MSTHSAPSISTALRVAASIAAVILPLACGDSTSPVAAPVRYVVTTTSTNPIAGDSVVLRAQLVDADDKPVSLSGRTVGWTSNTGGRLNTPTSVTSANGEAATVYVTDTVAGVVQRVLARDLNGTEGFSPDIIPISGPPASYEVTATSYAPTVASDIIISAQLADLHHNAVKRADRIVTWSANFEGESSGKFSAPTSTTNADGVATVTYTMAPRVSGPLIVFAVDNFSDHGSSKPINTQPAPMAKYVITASVIDPPAGAGVLIFAQAADTYGNSVAVSGRTLTWSTSGSGGSFAAPTTLTDDNGSSSIVFTTGSVPGGAYTVSITDGTGFAGTTPTINTTQQISLQSVAAGFGATSTCGIADDGKAWCWGANDLGGLGNGTTLDRSLPGKVSASLTMTALSAGLYHSCGISAGIVYCWGRNKDGQLGDNTYTARSSPAPINSSLSFTAVSAGTDHTCAIATGGDAYCWGLRVTYRLGDGGLSTGESSPVKVGGGLSFVAISAGVDHTCAITTAGDAYCWGVNSGGKLGNNTVTPAATPAAVQGGLKFTSISVGEMHTCGISAGKAYCWGDNGSGQLGSQPNVARRVPTLVSGSLSFAQISAGGYHTCGLTTDGDAYCWGDNNSRELGNGAVTTTSSFVPTLVDGGYKFKSISVGGGLVPYDDYYYYNSTLPAGHSCAVTVAGVTYCWGSNSRGQLGVGLMYSQSATPLKLAGQP